MKMKTGCVKMTQTGTWWRWRRWKNDEKGKNDEEGKDDGDENKKNESIK